MGNEQDQAAHRLHDQQGAGHFDRVILKELQDRAANDRAKQQRDEHHHGGNAVEDTILLHVGDAGGKVSTEAPFDVVRRGGENEGPDKAGKDALQIKDHHGLVLFEQKEEVLKFYRFCLISLRAVLFLDQEPADQGNHHRRANNNGDQDGKRVVIVPNRFVHRNQHGRKGGGNNTQHHGPHPGADDQLGAFIGVIGHRPKQEVILVEGRANVEHEIEEDDPHDNQHRLCRKGRRERVEEDAANAGQQDAEEEEGLVFSDLGPLPAIHHKSLNRIVHRIKDAGEQEQRCGQRGSHGAQPRIVGHILHE